MRSAYLLAGFWVAVAAPFSCGQDAAGPRSAPADDALIGQQVARVGP